MFESFTNIEDKRIVFLDEDVNLDKEYTKTTVEEQMPIYYLNSFIEDIAVHNLLAQIYKIQYNVEKEQISFYASKKIYYQRAYDNFKNFKDNKFTVDKSKSKDDIIDDFIKKHEVFKSDCSMISISDLLNVYEGFIQEYLNFINHYRERIEEELKKNYNDFDELLDFTFGDILSSKDDLNYFSIAFYVKKFSSSKKITIVFDVEEGSIKRISKETSFFDDDEFKYVVAEILAELFSKSKSFFNNYIFEHFVYREDRLSVSFYFYKDFFLGKANSRITLKFAIDSGVCNNLAIIEVRRELIENKTEVLIDSDYISVIGKFKGRENEILENLYLPIDSVGRKLCRGNSIERLNTYKITKLEKILSLDKKNNKINRSKKFIFNKPSFLAWLFAK